MVYRVKVCWDGGYTETLEDIESFEARDGFIFLYTEGKQGGDVPFRIYSNRDVLHFEVEETE